MERLRVVEAGPGSPEYRVFRALSYYLFNDRGSAGEPIRLLALRGKMPCGLLLAVVRPNYLSPLENETGMKLVHLRGAATLCPGDAECLDALARALADSAAARAADAVVAFKEPGLPGFTRRTSQRGRRSVEYWILPLARAAAATDT